MGKSKKKSGWKKYLPFILVGGGAALVLFGQQFFKRATDNFIAGIGYKFHNIKLKIIGLSTLRVTGVMTITNTNPVGGKVKSFTGALTYGRNGGQLVPVNVASFNLPANGSADAQIISEVSLLSLAGSVIQVVQQIVGGDYKKLWLKGTLDTSFALIPIDTEITPFSA